MDKFLDVVKACRRSRVKLRVYSALRILRVATAAELADAADTTVDRVSEVMFGGTPDYRRVSSLVSLAVAVPVATAEDSFAITARGDDAWAVVGGRLNRGNPPGWDPGGSHPGPGRVSPGPRASPPPNRPHADDPASAGAS